MKLVRMEMRDFRCFANASVDFRGEAMLVLIGENDSGKSTIFDAIELLVGTRKSVTGNDFARRSDFHEQSSEIQFIGIFSAQEGTPHELLNDAGHLEIRRTFHRDGRSSLEVRKSTFDDSRLERRTSLKAEEEKSIIQSVAMTPESNTEKRQQQISDAINKGLFSKSLQWTVARPVDIEPHLPSIHRVSSVDFSDPMRTVRELVSAAISEALARDENAPVFFKIDDIARPSVADIERKIAQHLKPILSDIDCVKIKTSIDHRRPSVNVDVQLVASVGERSLTELGAGTRRRAWIALQHLQAAARQNRPCVRLYDEPDTNLHFEAQRHAFRAIRALSEADPTSTTIVCTHAVTLIDSVSPSSLRVVRAQTQGNHLIDALTEGASEDLSSLSDVGEKLGLLNSVLLFERAFLLVEGETEDGALPIMYHRMFGSRIGHDGIRIVNLNTCGAWSSVVRVLLRSRHALVCMLLDRDCEAPNSTAKLTENTLGQLGIDRNKVFLVGDKEFEDAFGDDVWCRTLNQRYAKEDGLWYPEEIKALRDKPKFSEALRAVVVSQCEKRLRSSATKPELGAALAASCQPNEVPSSIVDVFTELRKIAGVIT